MTLLKTHASCREADFLVAACGGFLGSDPVAEGFLLACRCGKSSMVECFLGCDLVDWLQQVGLAQDLGEAVLYGKRLQQGAVLQHIGQEHDFQDSRLHYRFLT